MTVAKKIISTLLVAAVAVGIGLVLALLLPQGGYPPPEPTPTEMADTTIHTGRLPGYENAPQNTTPEYFWYLFNGSLAMGKDGSLPLLLENTPGNECVMRVRYTLADGTVLPIANSANVIRNNSMAVPAVRNRSIPAFPI